MADIETTYMQHNSTLERLTIPRADRVVVSLLVLFIAISGLVLWLVPWVQTAQGMGVVNALDPKDRTQAISALVPGQIKNWHVIEGQAVKAGDPIVTLIDTDRNLLERLQNEQAAIQRQQQANQKALETAQQDLVRRQQLFTQGLVSKRDVEQAEIRVEDMRAQVSKTQADLNRVEVNLARQSTQTKYAPQDGTILRLLAAGNATFVKAGDVLASFIPDRAERAVMLRVNGLDAPLVRPGRKVRLQFDGWPVFQFSGWPSAAIGTFGGVVNFVEPIADEQGNFRVWIGQDPDDRPWPAQQYVRLGSRAQGWVLLETVPLGYEMWRQLNNFPPRYPQRNTAESTQ